MQEADDPLQIITTMLKPSAGEEAAIQEHEEAKKAWQLRYEAAEHENGMIAVHALEETASAELSEAHSQPGQARAKVLLMPLHVGAVAVSVWRNIMAIRV